MSEETARRLEEARARASQRSAEAEDRKREFLAAIARDIPARVEKLAKRTTHAQVDASKALGREGIKELRTELFDRATELAKEVAAAADQIVWPKQQSKYSPVTSSGIHSALFKFLHRRMDGLVEIFKRRGFDVHDDNAQRAQSLVTPQDLYGEEEQAREFEALAEALNALSAEERALKEAQAAHDRDVVDSLWEDD